MEKYVCDHTKIEPCGLPFSSEPDEEQAAISIFVWPQVYFIMANGLLI